MLLFFLWCGKASPQSDTLSKALNKKRLWTVISTEAVGYSGTMIGLNALWYKDYPRSGFHFFNDNAQWLQMDKIGHRMSSYYIGKVGMDVLKWTGLKERKAVWYGGCLGLFLLSSVELFDGFSSEWGFSNGDAVANLMGTTLLIGQEYLWQKQRIQLKFSAHLTDYARYRPNVLGSTVPERILKDYNGQTYWLCVTPSYFLDKETKFPKWLSLAFGYSGEEMLKGDSQNYTLVTEPPGSVISFSTYRQYLLSLDINLERINTSSRFLSALFSTFNFVKIPFPALEMSQHGAKFRPFYF